MRRGAGPSGPAAPKLRAMHGMLSAAILICAFAGVAVACGYVVLRVYLAGARRDGAS
jgi:hypothetical protein